MVCRVTKQTEPQQKQKQRKRLIHCETLDAARRCLDWCQNNAIHTSVIHVAHDGGVFIELQPEQGSGDLWNFHRKEVVESLDSEQNDGPIERTTCGTDAADRAIPFATLAPGYTGMTEAKANHMRSANRWHRKRSWTDVPGQLSIEPYRHRDGVVYDNHRDEPIELPDLWPFIDDEFASYEIVIEFLCSGYDDPGCTLGAPEDCYPPESEDERQLDTAYLLVTQPADTATRKVGLPERLQQQLFDYYEERIYREDI